MRGCSVTESISLRHSLAQTALFLVVQGQCVCGTNSAASLDHLARRAGEGVLDLAVLSYPCSPSLSGGVIAPREVFLLRPELLIVLHARVKGTLQDN